MKRICILLCIGLFFAGSGKSASSTPLGTENYLKSTSLGTESYLKSTPLGTERYLKSSDLFQEDGHKIAEEQFFLDILPGRIEDDETVTNGKGGLYGPPPGGGDAQKLVSPIGEGEMPILLLLSILAITYYSGFGKTEKKKKIMLI